MSSVYVVHAWMMDFDEIFGGVGRPFRTDRLDCGGNPDQDLDPELFIICCDW